MKVDKECDQKICMLCKGLVCKHCNTADLKNPNICVTCAKYPLRNMKTNIIFAALRRGPLNMSLESSYYAHFLLLPNEEKYIKHYCPKNFLLQRIATDKWLRMVVYEKEKNVHYYPHR